MPEGRRPRRATQCLRSGAVTQSARLKRCRNGREELPHIRGQRQWPGGAAPRPNSGAADESTMLRQHRSNREELPHVRGQGRRLGGATLPEASGSGWEELPQV